MDILEGGCYYHIYNRGINSTNLFRESQNYEFFLRKYALYLTDYVDTYAYCLLKNHFHLLIRVKDIEILEQLSEKKIFQNDGLHSVEHLISKQFARLFSFIPKVSIKYMTAQVVCLKLRLNVNVLTMIII